MENKTKVETDKNVEFNDIFLLVKRKGVKIKGN